MKRYSWLFALVIASITFSCGERIDEDEMWCEIIEIDGASHIALYHNDKCIKPPFCQIEKKISYLKKVPDVFDTCFHEVELDMMTAISRYNYVNSVFLGLEDKLNKKDYEYIIRAASYPDVLPCTHTTRYALMGDSLIRLDSIWSSIEYHRQKSSTNVLPQ